LSNSNTAPVIGTILPNLTQRIDRAKSDLKFGIANLPDCAVEQFRNMLRPAQIRLPQGCIRLLISSRNPEPSQIEAEGTTE
jgi:hypothetical protein